MGGYKRIYRIYRAMALNLRIKPKKRLVREKSAQLTAPDPLPGCWPGPTSNHALHSRPATKVLSPINVPGSARKIDYLPLKHRMRR
ncbi:hypothetical protein [Thermithiobacillus plumbiphilus]|uniref:Transposase n=1 Tax=Thermithiobacillus plumbiphilus TaxID=1729899 RepID=A0ABU9D8A8_9PROT